MQKNVTVKKPAETIEVETHQIVAHKNRFRAQMEATKKAMNDPENSIFWTEPAGSIGRMRVIEALVREQQFNINGQRSLFDVIDLRGVVNGKMKIVSFPSFVLRTAEAAAAAVEAHDDTIMNMDPVPESVAFRDRPWQPVKEPFLVEATFAIVNGNSRIVHLREVVDQ